jgi:hypothetical protein
MRKQEITMSLDGVRKWCEGNPLSAFGVAVVFCLVVYFASSARPANLDLVTQNKTEQNEPLVSATKLCCALS